MASAGIQNLHPMASPFHVQNLVLELPTNAVLSQADLIPQLSGVLMMQPLARTATNAAYHAAASGDAATEEFRIQLHDEKGVLAFAAPLPPDVPGISPDKCTSLCVLGVCRRP